MPNQKADLIIHPARLQILAALTEQPMTIQELDARLPEIPKSSLYRHVRALLEGGYVQVKETRPVKGTLEKVFSVQNLPHLTQADVAGLSREECLRYFVLFMISQIQDFARYLSASPDLDFQGDRAGYSMAVLHMSGDERDQLLTDISKAAAAVGQNPAGGERKAHKIVFITHPYV